MIVSNQDDKVELTPGKVASDTKPRGAAAMLEGMTAIQRELDV